MSSAQQATPKKPRSTVNWAILVGVLVVAVVGTIYTATRNEITPYVDLLSNSNTLASVNPAVSTEGWQVYTNPKLGLFLKHPKEWLTQTVNVDGLDRRTNDAVLSKGTCPNGGCAINTDVCEVVISQEHNLTDTQVAGMRSWLTTRPYYQGGGVEQMKLGGFDSLRTKVTVTPPGDGATQGLGTYFLISSNTAGALLSATLTKGFADATCSAEMTAILQTITQDAIVSVDTRQWNTYQNRVWGFSFRYPKEWTFTRDLLPKQVKSNTSPTEELLIGLPTEGGQDARPAISIVMNPDGFGPLFPDLIYTVARSTTGFVIVNEQSVTTQADREPGFYQIQAVESSGLHTFDMFFSTNEQDKAAWSAVVKAMLASFRFTQ